MKRFRFHWPEGTIEESEGEGVVEAFLELGWSLDAIVGISHYEEL